MNAFRAPLWVCVGHVGLLAALLPGCSAVRAVEIPFTVSRYDTLAPLDLAAFSEARALSVDGEVHEARAAFERLYESAPDNVGVGIWCQETELAAAIADIHDEAEARAALAAHWDAAARERPTVAAWVLAARVAPDRARALAALDTAEALDPHCAWVHYGRAFLAAQASEWPVARLHIERAKAADPGHLWTFWLEAWMSTRTGSLDEAASALLGFVERAADDPRIQPRLLDDLRLDLALVWTLRAEPHKARDLVEAVDPRSVDVARRLSAISSVEQALGELGPALAAAEAAERAAPGEILPVVQQALLFDEWLGDAVKAEAAWRRVLELAQASSELTAVLERTRAGVRLERFARDNARRAGP